MTVTTQKTARQNHSIRLADYDTAEPFASFLPGIAGSYGTPMWVFYTNRNQLITSFGTRNKDGAFLEFYPANKAYALVDRFGFRTFVRSGSAWYEPFGNLASPAAARTLHIDPASIGASEESPDLRVEIEYFTVPEEPIGAMVRTVRITSRRTERTTFSIIDGLPAVVPFGVEDSQLKRMSNTAAAWMAADIHSTPENEIATFAIPATIGDETSVGRVEAVHFAAGHVVVGGSQTPMIPIIDPDEVFQGDRSCSAPRHFPKGVLTRTVSSRQPSALFACEVMLGPGETAELTELYGYARTSSGATRAVTDLGDPAVVERWRRTNRDIIAAVQAPTETRTAVVGFDSYVAQTQLDNVLRGGIPQRAGSLTTYVYSRRHGDMERDYNWFELPAEAFSSGAGNFRDVVQNRRNDVRLHPEVGSMLIEEFLELLRPDGYNPLAVEPPVIMLSPGGSAALERVCGDAAPAVPVTIGAIVEVIRDALPAGGEADLDSVLSSVLEGAEREPRATHGEGFWIDHWTYLCDLIDTYQSVYPDLWLETATAGPLPRSFDSAVRIAPQSTRLAAAGETIMRRDALEVDPARQAEIDNRFEARSWVRDLNTGEVHRESIVEKLMILGILKSLTLDPSLLGVEMEADKPGWYDALNGLPGQYGSSTSEVFDLLRLVRIVRKTLHGSAHLSIALEHSDLLREASALAARWLGDRNDTELYREAVAIRERFRESVFPGFSGEKTTLASDELLNLLSPLLSFVENSVERVVGFRNEIGYLPTYFTHEPDTWSGDESGTVTITGWRRHALPRFLEGYVKALRTAGPSGARDIYREVRESPLFDQALRMYRVNEPLDSEPHSIGRARAFPAGWLENGSIWLHMEYKYLLEVLRSGLHEEFWEDARTCLVPLMQFERYGRPLSENSSFLVSSLHHDERLHGRGYVARLTGASAELLSMWFHIMAGERPFRVDDDGQLELRLQPVLPGWLFPESAVIGFRFLGHTWVEHVNPARTDLFPGGGLVCTGVEVVQGESETRVEGDALRGEHAIAVREGRVDSLRFYWESSQ